MNVEMLSRIQFAFTITFHYIYPPLSIGLSLALICMGIMYLKTKEKVWEKMIQFWLKVFSMTFALGVGTGIPMMFALGTNWAKYSRFVGDVSGSIIGAEGTFAFLIEAGFLGVAIFGWKRISAKMHLLAITLVSLGAHFSAIWIISFNSWMHAPTGYKLTRLSDRVEVAQLANWNEVFFSPLNMNHIIHVLLGAWMTGAFLMLSVAAYYLLKNIHLDFAKKTLKLSILMALITSVLQLVSADSLARRVAKVNPEKFAAFEGVYQTRPYTPAYLFGWVDSKEGKIYGLGMPGLLSFMTYRNLKQPVTGLDHFPPEQHPWVPGVFQVYHLMVMMWALMTGIALLGSYYILRNQWKIPRWFLKIMVASVVFPQLANIGGWYSSCMGRQPWIVYKLMKTKDAFSPIISTGQVLGSLIMFVFMYTLFFILFLVLLDRKIKNGPDIDHEEIPYRNTLKNQSNKRDHGH